MSTVLRLALMACPLLLAAADPQWQSLFDGKTFKGWEDPTKKTPPGTSFVIEDGCLKATAHPAIDEDIFTEQTFGDFELEWDWKISPRGNSGLKYRIQDRIMLLDEKLPRFEDQVNAAMKSRRADRPAKGQEYVIGFEFQITDNATNPDARRTVRCTRRARYTTCSRR